MNDKYTRSYTAKLPKYQQPKHLQPMLDSARATAKAIMLNVINESKRPVGPKA